MNQPHNIVIITQARLGSTRLPRKVLLPAGKKTLIEHHIERLKGSELPFRVATTTEASDQELHQFLTVRGIPYFKGSEQDVLSRYYECARSCNADVIVRVTSDCPLIDGTIIREAVDQYILYANSMTYLSNVLKRTYPRGFDFEIFSFALLEEAHRLASTPEDREHVTPFIRLNRTGGVKNIDFLRHADASSFRVTVDTPEDYQLIKKLIEEFGGDTLSAEEIISILEAHPELVEINDHVEQKKSESV